MSNKSDAESYQHTTAAEMRRISDQVCDNPCWDIASAFVCITMKTMERAAASGAYQVEIPADELSRRVGNRWPDMKRGDSVWQDHVMAAARFATLLLERKGYVVRVTDDKISISWAVKT